MAKVTDTAAAAVDRAAAEEQYEAIFREYFPRLRAFVLSRLWVVRDYHLAEDLAQEAMIELWRSHIKRGVDIRHPFGLLCHMARNKMGQHYERMSSNERALDFTDSVNTPIVATGHNYAPEMPELAATANEMDAAMERMRLASASWRALHRSTFLAKKHLTEGYRGHELTAERRERYARNARRMEAQRDAALAELQKACGEVGTLRAELERAGGGNWKSSSDLPTPVMADGKARAGSITSDVARTRCDKEHDLTLDNVIFETDGRRRCRTCTNEGQRVIREHRTPRAAALASC